MGFYYCVVLFLFFLVKFFMFFKSSRVWGLFEGFSNGRKFGGKVVNICWLIVNREKEFDFFRVVMRKGRKEGLYIFLIVLFMFYVWDRYINMRYK